MTNYLHSIFQKQSIMQRILLYLIVMLFVAGFAVAFVPFLVPGVAQALDPLICPGDETIALHQQSAARGGVNITFRCVDAEGNSREVGFAPYLILFTAWCWLPLIPGVLWVVSVRLQGDQSPQTASPAISTAARKANSTLTEKLQQLEDAYKAGLITQEQYEKSKQDLLDNLTGS
jgi:hypothetical protein